MARPPGRPVAQISALKPGGSLILSIGMSAAGVTVSLPAKGAKVLLAMAAGMPCFQAGAGAAGAWAKAATVQPSPATQLSCATRGRSACDFMDQILVIKNK